MAKLTERQIKIIVKIQTLSAAIYIDKMNIEGIHQIPGLALLAAKCARDGIAISSAMKAGAEFEDLLCIALEIK
jgi:hypothetical protein